MRLDIQTVIREADLLAMNDRNYMIIETKYGWHCPECNEYVSEYVQESFSMYRAPDRRETIINRILSLHNDGEDWCCSECRSPEARRKRLILKKFSLEK